ncbi:DUF2752 domain-containing protein [Streptomyces marincola]|uniref:DUF2752 domain-containing protein n=1 Tax=Streptomyces marincola TaxID=2878388 RepID=UPI001CF392F4|nr:DUF2752 domain-containing protein [Streptomyces marincola]UCM88627.1 DUF2752 domain-containing protein [Streptomyces marincola]
MAARRFRHPAVPPLAALATGLAGAAYLWHTDPHEGGALLPRCPVNWATGLDCPACGGTRMAYHLLHADVPAAFQDNALLLVAGVPLGAWLGGRWLWEGLRGRRYRPRFARWQAALVVGGAVAWAVLRNLAQ